MLASRYTALPDSIRIGIKNSGLALFYLTPRSRSATLFGTGSLHMERELE